MHMSHVVSLNVELELVEHDSCNCLQLVVSTDFILAGAHAAYA